MNQHVSKRHGCLERYYHEFYPRRDLYSKDLIEFENGPKYCRKFFNNRHNENRWLQDNPQHVTDWYEFLLQSFKQPIGFSWVEWMSLRLLPYEKVDIKDLCSRLGCQMRFGYSEPEWAPPADEANILVDSREQKPLLNKRKTKINAGDYILEGSFYNKIHVDRKNLPDFIQTFTTGIKRFREEMEKATACGAYMVVLVENDFWECLNYIPRRFGQKVTGSFAFVGVRKLMFEYPNLQFLFVDGREKAVEWLKLILGNPEIAKTKDLQYLYDVV